MLNIQKRQRAGRKFSISNSGKLTAVRARLQVVDRVVGTLPIDGPTRAVIHGVLALAGADTARDRAVHIHEDRILRALSRVGPVVAVDVNVGAPRRAKPTAGGAVLEHVVRRGLALARLGPRTARLLKVLAEMAARAACVRADLLHVISIVTLAFACATPRTARKLTVVAIADR
eukprot:6194450-Pleurochrysis_carterae.AAC.1